MIATTAAAARSYSHTRQRWVSLRPEVREAYERGQEILQRILATRTPTELIPEEVNRAPAKLDYKPRVQRKERRVYPDRENCTRWGNAKHTGSDFRTIKYADGLPVPSASLDGSPLESGADNWAIFAVAKEEQADLYNHGNRLLNHSRRFDSRIAQRKWRKANPDKHKAARKRDWASTKQRMVADPAYAEQRRKRKAEAQRKYAAKKKLQGPKGA